MIIVIPQVCMCLWMSVPFCVSPVPMVFPSSGISSSFHMTMSDKLILIMNKWKMLSYSFMTQKHLSCLDCTVICGTTW